jgi:hypothetical protein
MPGSIDPYDTGYLQAYSAGSPADAATVANGLLTPATIAALSLPVSMRANVYTPPPPRGIFGLPTQVKFGGFGAVTVPTSFTSGIAPRFGFDRFAPPISMGPMRFGQMPFAQPSSRTELGRAPLTAAPNLLPTAIPTAVAAPQAGFGVGTGAAPQPYWPAETAGTSPSVTWTDEPIAAQQVPPTMLDQIPLIPVGAASRSSGPSPLVASPNLVANASGFMGEVAMLAPQSEVLGATEVAPAMIGTDLPVSVVAMLPSTGEAGKLGPAAMPASVGPSVAAASGSAGAPLVAILAVLMGIALWAVSFLGLRRRQ